MRLGLGTVGGALLTRSFGGCDDDACVTAALKIRCRSGDRGLEVGAQELLGALMQLSQNVGTVTWLWYTQALVQIRDFCRKRFQSTKRS